MIGIFTNFYFNLKIKKSKFKQFNYFTILHYLHNFSDFKNTKIIVHLNLKGSQHQTPPTLLRYICGYHVEFGFYIIGSWSWHVLIVRCFSLGFTAKGVLCSWKLWFFSIFIRAWCFFQLWSKISTLSSSNPKNNHQLFKNQKLTIFYYDVLLFISAEVGKLLVLVIFLFFSRLWWYFLFTGSCGTLDLRFQRFILFCNFPDLEHLWLQTSASLYPFQFLKTNHTSDHTKTYFTLLGFLNFIISGL